MTSNPDVLRAVEILDFRRQPYAFKKKRVKKWFASDEPNVLGAALDAVLMNAAYIEPAVTRVEVGEFLARVFDCAIQNQGATVSSYAFSCYEIGREFCAWLIEAQTAQPESDAIQALEHGETFLRSRYLSGDQETRNCIVAGVVEHLFEVPGFRERFAGWCDDPILADAYTQATAWSTWVSARIASIRPVIERAAERLVAKGAENVSISPRSLGATALNLSWERDGPHELTFSCDDDWADAVAHGRGDVELATEFALARENWSQVDQSGRRYSVVLIGDKLLS